MASSKPKTSYSTLSDTSTATLNYTELLLVLTAQTRIKQASDTEDKMFTLKCASIYICKAAVAVREREKRRGGIKGSGGEGQ